MSFFFFFKLKQKKDLRKIGSFIQNVVSEAKVTPDGLNLVKFCLYGIYYCHVVWGSVPVSMDELRDKCPPPVPRSRQLPALPAQLQPHARRSTVWGRDATSCDPKLASGRSVLKEGKTPRYKLINHQRGPAGRRCLLPTSPTAGSAETSASHASHAFPTLTDRFARGIVLGSATEVRGGCKNC